jgi:RNA polymerase sigma-70 factor (ECF subfamily)
MDQSGGFEQWYTASFDSLVASLCLITGSTDAATEAASEACARCLRRWSTTGPPDNPSAWTYRVALNLLRRQWSRRSHEQEVLRSGRSTEVPAADAPAIELWAAVARLPRRARTAVALRYLGDLTEAEVARVMGIAPGTVAATLSKARATLAGDLDNDAKEGSHA